MVEKLSAPGPDNFQGERAFAAPAPLRAAADCTVASAEERFGKLFDAVGERRPEIITILVEHGYSHAQRLLCSPTA